MQARIYRLNANKTLFKMQVLGTHCEKKMYCTGYERHENGS